MRIEPVRVSPNTVMFAIVRGKDEPSYFALFVDSDKVSWTKNLLRGLAFQTEEDALDAMGEIRRRLEK